MKYACSAGAGGVPITVHPRPSVHCIFRSELKNGPYEIVNNIIVGALYHGETALVINVRRLPYEPSPYSVALRHETHMDYLYVIKDNLIGWCEGRALSKVVL